MENLPEITPDDVKKYSRKIAGVFEWFKSAFKQRVLSGGYVFDLKKQCESDVRDVMDELSSKY